MTELRTRIIEDMQLAGLSQGTQEAYVKSVRQLAGHFHLSPDRITERQLCDYLILQRGASSKRLIASAPRRKKPYLFC